MATEIAILGAGAWGTALAVHLASRDPPRASVTLWGRSAPQIAAMRASRRNARYLPGTVLPAALALSADLHAAVRADILIVATPVDALVDLAQGLRALGAHAPLAWLSKGFVATGAAPPGVGLAHQVIAPGRSTPVAVISGPSFADEVARGLPAALVVAGTGRDFARELASVLHGESLRAYDSDDIAGVETGGAIKNVLAIAAGASDGLGFGHNARAALITRGLAETARLSTALGGDPKTLMGLAGLGDLVLTCTGDLSRNRRVGLALARGEKLPTILRALGHVAEGVHAAQAAMRLALHHGLDLPITAAVYRVLYEDLPVQRAVEALLAREARSE
jgi:glycerol-3-phosphate dehydrogenase (NAD(P)+)